MLRIYLMMISSGVLVVVEDVDDMHSTDSF